MGITLHPTAGQPNSVPDLLPRCRQAGSVSCFTEGTNSAHSQVAARCVCTPGYTGQDCGVPRILENATIGSAQISLKIAKQKQTKSRGQKTLLLIHKYKANI